jgi:hypothetical protein
MRSKPQKEHTVFIERASEFRQLLQKAIPEETAHSADTRPPREHLYIPRSHTQALNPNNMLVEGIRGSGKTFWWSALQHHTLRAFINKVLPDSELSSLDCNTGFGENQADGYPSKRVLQELLTAGIEAKDIWYTVVAWNILKDYDVFPKKLDGWQERISFVKQHLEKIEKSLRLADQQFQQKGSKYLLLFDALDRTADDWPSLKKLLKGLLQVLLEFRSSKSLRLKAFVRPDMLADDSVFEFPDSSKIQANKVKLEWTSKDLFGLLWQYLGNCKDSSNDYGKIFREACDKEFAQKWQKYDTVWIMPNAMRTDEDLQRKLFHQLAGPWMGASANRGAPYTWLPNHLGDGYAQTSPRSFLAALREATLDDSSPGYKYALHYQSIKKGVQRASRIRINELKEDYPWLEILLAPLNGKIIVPCDFTEIAELWKRDKVLDKLKLQEESSDNHSNMRLPPSHLREGPEGVIQNLIDLGIFQSMGDGRLNMPDVYRVGYGLGRKGGIKPIR